jgi:hypothetical protein
MEIEVLGYQEIDYWIARKQPGYNVCNAVVRHRLGATAPCVLERGHEQPHEAIFIVRYEGEAKERLAEDGYPEEEMGT